MITFAICPEASWDFHSCSLSCRYLTSADAWAAPPRSIATAHERASSVRTSRMAGGFMARTLAHVTRLEAKGACKPEGPRRSRRVIRLRCGDLRRGSLARRFDRLLAINLREHQLAHAHGLGCRLDGLVGAHELERLVERLFAVGVQAHEHLGG